MNITKEKRIVSRDQEVIFTNWTDRDFTHTYDFGSMSSDGKRWIAKKKSYTLKAGKSYYLPFFLAELFAKHLADREYQRAFNSKLEEMKANPALQMLDRRNLEHRVQNSQEISKLSRQEMMDRCVEIIPGNDDLEMANPKEVKHREVILERDKRAKELRDQYPGIEVKANEKAIKQLEQEEEFEGEE